MWIFCRSCWSLILFMLANQLFHFNTFFNLFTYHHLEQINKLKLWKIKGKLKLQKDILHDSNTKMMISIYLYYDWHLKSRLTPLKYSLIYVSSSQKRKLMKQVNFFLNFILKTHIIRQLLIILILLEWLLGLFLL